MAIINNYPLVNPKLTDLILGTSAGSNGRNQTASFTVSALQSIVAGVISVTSGNANTIVIGGTTQQPTVGSVTAAIVQNGLSLATGGDIYTFVTTNHPGTVSGTGTFNTLTKWSANGADIEDSAILDNASGETITITSRQVWPATTNSKDLGGIDNRWKNLWASQTLYAENIALTGTNTYLSLSGSTGTAGQVLTSGGAGASATWTDNGNVSGTGTINTVPIFTGATAIGNSLISQAADTVIINGSSTDGRLQLNCSAGTHGVALQSPPHSAAATYTLILPQTTGTAGQVLTSAGGTPDQLTWATNGNIGGTGTGEKISKWTGAGASTTLGDSIITEQSAAGDFTASYIEISGAGGLSTQNAEINGWLLDSANSKGATGQLLSSTGSVVNWIDAPITGVVTVTQGTDISVTGTASDPIINNTAPDQTVVITGTGGTVVTGTYPNFTVNSDNLSGYVQSVTSADANVITIGGTSADPTVGANTATIVNSGPNLATGGQIVTYTTGLTINDLTAPAANFSMNSNKIIDVTTPTAANDAANKSYVDNVLTGALIYQGGYNASTNSPDLTTSPNSIQQGWTYAVTAAGNASGFWSPTLNIGDLVIANINNPTSASEWTEVQANIDIATDTVQGIANFPTSGGLTVTTGAVSIANTAVTAGTYTNANLTVDAQGRITTAANGSAGTISGTGTANIVPLWTGATALGNSAIAQSNTGNVGIGTTSPTTPLHIEGSGVGYIQTIKNTTAGGDLLQMLAEDGNPIFEFISEGTGGEGVFSAYSDNVKNVQISADPSNYTYFNASNVGINVTDPDAQLEIVNSLGGSYRLGYSGTDAYFDAENFYVRSGNGNTNKVIIDSSGNVGIGTTTPAVKLEVIGSVTSGIRLKSSAVSSNGFNIYNDSASDTAVLSNYYAGPMVFKTNNTERMRIESNGDVKLTTSAKIGYYETDGIHDGYFVPYNSSGQLEIVNSFTSGAILFKTGTSKLERMRINSNGSIAINGDQYLYAFPSTSNTGFIGSGFSLNGASNTMQLWTNNAERMRIDSSGNVGIGTTSPTSVGGGAKLTVSQGADGNIVFARGGSTRQVQLGTTSTTGYINADNASGGLTFNINTTERMRIASTGQVKFNAYTSASAFTGTAVANLAVDSNGDIITEAAGGGSSLPTITVNTGAGTGAQTVYPLSVTPSSVNYVNVFINGVYQAKSSYSVSGTNLTFATAPPNNSVIEFVTTT